MATKKTKNYYYVLVLSEDGPKYVTQYKLYPEKFAYWEKSGKPYDFGNLDSARTMALGLSFNGCSAVPVVLNYELDSQPFLYEEGQFKWHWDEDEK